MTSASDSTRDPPRSEAGPDEVNWQLALDHGSEGLWDWNTQTDRVRYSENLRDVLGLDDPDCTITIDAWAELVHPEDRPHAIDALQRYRYGTASVYENEHRVRCGDGRYKWMRARGRHIDSAPDGRPLRIVGSYLDIDERKTVAAALRDSEQRLQHIAARLPGSVFEFVLRPDGTSGLPYVSAGFHKLFRVDADEIRDDGLVAYRYLDPTALDEVRESILESAAQLTLWSQELPMHFPDGERRWLYAESMPERLADGTTRWHGFVGDITERRQIEEALRESEQRLQRIAARIPGVVFEFLLRPDGTMALPYASAGLYKLFGVTPDDVRDDATRVFRYLDPAVLQPVMQSIHESAVGLTLWRQELPMTFPSGERRWLHAESMPERLADGSTRWHGFVSDYSERRGVALALQDSEERLRRIADRVPGLVFEFRIFPDGHMSLPYASDAIRDMLGLTPDNVREDATPVFDRVHPDDLPRLRATIAHSAKTVTPVREDFRLRTPHGSPERWVRIDTVPMRTEDGVVLSHGVVTDITSAKRAEANVRREKAFVDALVQGLVTPTLVLDAEGRVRVWNRALETLTGVSAAEVVGTRNHGRVFYGVDRPMMADIVIAGSAADYAASYASFKPLDNIPDGYYSENWCTLRTGRTHFMSGAAAPIYHEDGTLAGVVETLYDLTERQTLQAELERTRDEALSATRAKSTFLANMSHEIRTPLNGIIGMTELLLDTVLSPPQREYVELVHSSGDHLLSVINDVLDFSRIEAGRIEIEQTDFDLWQLIEDVASALALRAQRAGLELVCFADPDVPRHLRGDPVRLRQVLLNLVGNGIKFTAAGEIELHAVAGDVDDTAATVRFTIRDTGIGIPQQRLHEVFAAFVQADASTTRQFGGSGLGLSISRQLVELMGGTLEVASTPGQGSTFSFTLDLARSTVVPTTLQGDATLSGARILVVDDNATNRHLLEVLLPRWGCRPCAVASGAEALEQLRAAAEAHDPFPLALIDMHMAGMDGVQLAQAIKATPLVADTTLVLLSSLGQHCEPHELAMQGFAASLRKPLRQSMLHECLVATLLRHLHGKTDAQTIPAASTDTAAQREQLRLLLVEDNPVNQKVALGLLSRLGYQADVVDTGVAALEVLQRTRYDLVLMDCHLPVMDGFTATRAIRDPASMVLDHAVPIIAMTADVLAGDRDACLAAGMNDYVAKPIEPDILAGVLRKWATAAPLREVGPAPTGDPEETLVEFAGSDFDRPALLRNVMGDDTLAGEVVAAFRLDIAQALARLDTALTTEDRTQSVRICHTLKGTAASVGAMRMQACARAMEQRAMAGDLPAVRALLPSLRAAYSRFNDIAGSP